jgi:hypothetical protein
MNSVELFIKSFGEFLCVLLSAYFGGMSLKLCNTIDG